MQWKRGDVVQTKHGVTRVGLVEGISPPGRMEKNPTVLVRFIDSFSHLTECDPRALVRDSGGGVILLLAQLDR